MGLFFIFIFGVLIGGIGTAITIIFRYRAKFVGYLRFYDSEPGEEPVMIAELSEPVTDIYERNYVTFEVSHK